MRLDELVRSRPLHAVRAHLDVLDDQEMRKVSCAAYALRRLGDQSAMSRLIDALVTTRTVVRSSLSSSGAVTATFDDTGTRISARRRATTVRLQVPQYEVLSALVVLSGGVSFHYN